jgi:branched-chain amino acid transport system substrate-binding protein
MRWKATAVLTTAVLAMAGCGSDGGGSTGPIKVGAISSLSGVPTFPEASAAAKAVFDDVNAAGGIGGRKIQYIVQDDKNDPAAAAQAARDLVLNQGVVAMAGSASTIECQANAAFYVQQKIGVIQGTGVDPACFGSPNISPANVGPFLLTTAMLYYAEKNLGLRRICNMNIILGGTGKAYAKAVGDFTKLTGVKLTLNDATLPAQGDWTPYILKARSAGCQAVLTNLTEPMVVQWMKTAQAQHVKGITWLFLAPAYTTSMPKAVGAAGEDMLAGTEFAPFTDPNSSATRQWADTMNRHKVALSAFAQGGYLAAEDLVTVLKGIKGKVNRESVTKALKSMRPIPSPMLGTPYVFGPGRAHNSNRATQVMALRHGTWQPVTQGWVRLPGAGG